MRKVLLGLIGGLLILVGGGACVGGALFTGVFGRDGVVRSDPVRITADVAALTTDVVTIDAGLPRTEGLAAVELSARAVDGGRVFVGIGRADRVRTYLAGTPYAVVSGIDGSPGSEAQVSLRIVDGGDRPTPPAAEDFWVTSSVGAGDQRIHWSPAPGPFVAVIMGAEADVPVDAQVSAGLSLPWIFPIALAAIVAGAILVILGATVLFLAFRQPRRQVRIVLPTEDDAQPVTAVSSPVVPSPATVARDPSMTASSKPPGHDAQGHAPAQAQGGPQGPPREPDGP